MKGNQAPNPLGKDEMAKVDALTATPGGKKLLDQGVPFTADLVTSRKAELSTEAIENCGQGKAR